MGNSISTKDIIKIGYSKVDHMVFFGDYNNVVMEIAFCGMKFYRQYKRKSLFDYSYKYNKWRIFMNIKSVFKGNFAKDYYGAS